MDEHLNDPDIASLLPPDKLDFCWIIPVFSQAVQHCKDGDPPEDFENPSCGFPMRPIPVKEMPHFDLSMHHVARLEHCENVYRLYDFTPSTWDPPLDDRPVVEPKGVFRGQHQQFVVESISKLCEFYNFRGLLIYNEQAYDAAKRDWKNYWEWRGNRNEARYRTQESGEVDCDVKNMMHCFRLLWSGKHIMEHGCPIVRFEGEKLDELMKIRNGAYTHAELMEWAEAEEEELGQLREKTRVPYEADLEKINELYLEIRMEK